MATGTIKFQKMSENEFSEYRGPMLENYARDIARNFNRPIDEVRVEAKKQTDELLKDGLSTPGHYLLNVIDSSNGAIIGHVWFNVQKDKKRAFLYDILIHEPYRGRGYGRATMKLLETELQQMGVSEVGLHVFAHNQIAINLYKSEGYYTSSYNMQKDLRPN